MACAVDHSTLVGKSFCTSCGEKIAPAIRYCSNGHELAQQLKFCTTCGEAVSQSTTTTYQQPTPPRIPNIRLPVAEQPASFAMPSQSFNSYSSSSDDQLNFSSRSTPDPMTTGVNSPVVRYIAMGIGVAMVAGFAIFKIAGNVATTDVTVNMTINSQTCSDLSWGYGDIPGGTVNLSVDGVPVGSTNYSSTGIDIFGSCKFTATIPGVKENGNSYTITSGNALRGSVTDTKDQLAGNSWTFDLSLGH